MVARRVGTRFGVGTGRPDALEVGDAPDEHRGRVTEVFGQALLDGGGDLRLALGSRREEDVARLDVGRDARVAQGIEGGPQLVHGEASVAGDIDAPEQRDVAGHEGNLPGRSGHRAHRDIWAGRDTRAYPEPDADRSGGAPRGTG